MDDIRRRLRSASLAFGITSNAGLLCAEAAVEIDRLRAELSEHERRIADDELQREVNAQWVGEVDLGDLRREVADFARNDEGRSPRARKVARHARALLACISYSLRPAPLPAAGCACSACATLRSHQADRLAPVKPHAEAPT